MQILSQNTLFSIILFLLLIPIELIIFYFILGRRSKSIEFKVAIGYICSLNLIEILLSVNLDILDLGIFYTLILSPLIIIIPCIVLYYILKFIKTNRLTLKKTIDASTEASVNIANMATELAASAGEVNASAEEISATTQEVSSGALTQVKQLSNINQTAARINELAERAKNSSDGIYKIMGLITNIAEQTNLLALNASIEAGRAGEHGRGFAVVADEVRKLAEESKGAVGNSNEKIMEIIDIIEKTASSIREISDDIQMTLSLSEETSAAMEEINSSAEEQTASMEEIATTSNRLGELSEDLKKKLTGKRINKKTSLKRYS